MRFFKQKQHKGWMALKTNGEDICFAHVERRAGARPVVREWGCRRLDLRSDAALKELAASLELNARHCLAVLSRAEYQLLQINALNVPREELRQAVRWGIKDLLDYPVTEATVDVLDIPFDQDNPARQHYMYAVAARNEVIRARMEQFIERFQAGLEVIDIPELAQRNIAACLEQEGRGLALLSFNRDGGLLTFTAQGELYHARQIDVTMEQLQDPDEERRTRVYERVALDLQRSLDNFERQFSHVGVNRLLLAPFPMRAEFETYLQSYLYLNVDTFELADVFDISGVPALDDVALQARIFCALGAALREGVAR